MEPNPIIDAPFNINKNAHKPPIVISGCEKYCPIMSRPGQGSTITDADDRRKWEEKDWFIIGRVPWECLFPCIKERCMAWVSECDMSDYLNSEEPNCPAKGKGCPTGSPGTVCYGWCKLIERGHRV